MRSGIIITIIVGTTIKRRSRSNGTMVDRKWETSIDSIVTATSTATSTTISTFTSQ